MSTTTTANLRKRKGIVCASITPLGRSAQNNASKVSNREVLTWSTIDERVQECEADLKYPQVLRRVP